MEILENNLPKDVSSKLKVVTIEKLLIEENRVIINAHKFKEFWTNRDFDRAFNHGFMAKIKHSWIYNHFTDDTTKKNKIVLYLSQPITISEIINHQNQNALNSVGNHCVVVKGIKKRKSRLNSDNNLTTDTQNNWEEFLEIENLDGGRNSYISVENSFFEEVEFIVDLIFRDLGGDEFQNERKKILKRYGKFLEKKLSTFENDRHHLSFIYARYPCFQLKFTT